MKLKIRPSDKIKRRYLLIEASKKNIENAIIEGLGVLGWAEASPVFVDKVFKLPQGYTVLSIERRSLDKVRTACEISSPALKIKRVSGTLKGLSESYGNL